MVTGDLVDHLTLSFREPLGLVSLLREGLVRHLCSCFGQDESGSRVSSATLERTSTGRMGSVVKHIPTADSGNRAQVSGVALLVMHAISQCNLARADQAWRHCIGLQLIGLMPRESLGQSGEGVEKE